MRIMSMDVGDKRIGMAISDLLGYTAQGIDTFVRENNENDIIKIKSIIDQYKPDEIVIGMPKNMNGTIGEQGRKTLDFGERLAKELDIKITYWDERLTSASANKILTEGNVKRKKRKDNVDKLAAVFILQAYLDYKNSNKE